MVEENEILNKRIAELEERVASWEKEHQGCFALAEKYYGKALDAALEWRQKARDAEMLQYEAQRTQRRLSEELSASQQEARDLRSQLYAAEDYSRKLGLSLEACQKGKKKADAYTPE